MADNVIKAVFASGRRVKTAPLWRYDHGIRLLPVGLELPDNYEMHFSNSKTGEAKTQLADATGAVIPAEYLIPGTEVYAWLYLVGDSFGRTKAEIIIPVDPKALPTDQEPTPEQQPVIEQAIDALNEAVDGIQEQIDSALAEAKASGEFDGAPGQDGTDGAQIWYSGRVFRTQGEYGYVYTTLPTDLTGKSADPAVDDYVFGPESGYGDPENLYIISSITVAHIILTKLGSIIGPPGQDGQDGQDGHDGTDGTDGIDGVQTWWCQAVPSNYVVMFAALSGKPGVTPVVGDFVYGPEAGSSGDVTTLYEITQVQTNRAKLSSIGTIGGGGGGTSDYTGLTNKPQIEGVTLSGNKTASDLGLAKTSDIPSVPSAATATPSDLGTAAVGSSTKYAREDHVHKKPTYSKSDVGLGSVDNVQQYSASNPPPYPVTSVNGQTGAVSLSIPSTAGDVGAIPAPASPSSAQELVYISGAWVAADKVYIVNLTPTALDYSGTMDKTVAEIYAAYQAGKTIVFRVWLGVGSYYDAVSEYQYTANDNNYPSFNTYIIEPNLSALFYVWTGATDDGTNATYGTTIYPISESACIPAPSSPTTGDFLCWNGSAWAATSLSTWQGGNY